MSRLHSTVTALVIGAAVVAGVFAAVQTVRLGQSVAAASPASTPGGAIASGRAKLARWSHSLHAALARKPPALPRLPHYAPVAVPAPAAPGTAVAQAGAPRQPRVEYVQPPPVVQYRQATTPTSTTASTTSSWEDDASEDGGSGSDDGSQSGGGGD